MRAPMFSTAQNSVLSTTAYWTLFQFLYIRHLECLVIIFFSQIYFFQFLSLFYVRKHRRRHQKLYIDSSEYQQKHMELAQPHRYLNKLISFFYLISISLKQLVDFRADYKNAI